MTDLSLRIREIIAECVSGCPLAPEEMKAATQLRGDLGADSLEVLEVAFSLEEEFGLSISDDVVEEFQTVGDIVAYMRLREGERA